MNDCMWAVFYLGATVSNHIQNKKLMNHQIRKTQTIITTVQNRIEELVLPLWLKSLWVTHGGFSQDGIAFGSKSLLQLLQQDV